MRGEIILYDVCDDSCGNDPFPSLGALYDTRAEALRELKKIRPEYPHAYIAKIVHAPYRKKPAKKGR